MGDLKHKIEIQFPWFLVSVSVCGIILSIITLTSDFFNSDSVLILSNNILVPLLTILLSYLSVKAVAQWTKREVVKIYEEGIVIGTFSSKFDQLEVLNDPAKGSYTFIRKDKNKCIQGNFKEEDRRTLDNLLSKDSI